MRFAGNPAVVVLAVLSVSAGFVAAVGGAAAYEVNRGDVVVGEPWTKVPLRADVASAVYLTIANHGTKPLQLTGAYSPVAANATLHVTVVGEDNVARMIAVRNLEIPPGEKAVLEPDGLHVMLQNLSRPLTEGVTFPLTLTFRDHNAITIDVIVEAVNARAPRTRPDPK